MFRITTPELLFKTVRAHKNLIHSPTPVSWGIAYSRMNARDYTVEMAFADFNRLARHVDDCPFSNLNLWKFRIAAEKRRLDYAHAKKWHHNYVTGIYNGPRYHRLSQRRAYEPTQMKRSRQRRNQPRKRAIKGPDGYVMRHFLDFLTQ